MLFPFASFIRSRKLLPRLVLGTIGAVAALAVVKAVEARAEEMPSDNVAAVIQSLSPELADVLSQGFPTEYASFKSAVAMEIAVGGDVEATTMRVLLDLKEQNAPYIAKAGDTALAALATSMSDLYRSVTDVDGPQVCAEYAIHGAGAMAGTDFAARHTRAALSNLATMLQAAREGRDHPVERRAATDAEWEAVAKLSLKRGATSEGFSALAQGVADPDLCPSVVAFLEAAQGDVGAELVRAEVLTLFATGE